MFSSVSQGPQLDQTEVAHRAHVPDSPPLLAFPQITFQINNLCLNTCLESASRRTKPRHRHTHFQNLLVAPQLRDELPRRYLLAQPNEVDLSLSLHSLSNLLYLHHLQDWGLAPRWGYKYQPSPGFPPFCPICPNDSSLQHLLRPLNLL